MLFSIGISTKSLSRDTGQTLWAIQSERLQSLATRTSFKNEIDELTLVIQAEPSLTRSLSLDLVWSHIWEVLDRAREDRSISSTPRSNQTTTFQTSRILRTLDDDITVARTDSGCSKFAIFGKIDLQLRHVGKECEAWQIASDLLTLEIIERFNS